MYTLSSLLHQHSARAIKFILVFMLMLSLGPPCHAQTGAGIWALSYGTPVNPSSPWWPTPPYNNPVTGISGWGSISGFIGELQEDVFFKLQYCTVEGPTTLYIAGVAETNDYVWYELTYLGSGAATSDPIYAAIAGVPSTAPDPTSQSGKSLGDEGAPYVGEPISVASGNVYDKIVDYETAGPNKLGFTRYYNSRSNVNVTYPVSGESLGVNWRCNYDRYLWLISDVAVEAERADGQILTFTAKGAAWKSDTDEAVTLTQSGSTWKLRDADGTVETYSAPGTIAFLSAIRFPNGYTQTIARNSSNDMTSVTDSYGRKLSFTYQSNISIFEKNLISTVTTPDGLVLTYGYDTSGGEDTPIDRLRSVSYSTSPRTGQTYNYDQTELPFALTSIVDENGAHYASWTYDQYGRGLSSRFGGSALLTQVSYNDTDGSRTVTNSLGQREVYKFAFLQGIPKVTEIDRLATATTSATNEKFTYDTNGYLASKTDRNGNLTTYVNDRQGRPTLTVEAVGTPQSRSTSIIYYGSYPLPTKIVTPQLTTTFTYDGGVVLTKTETDTTTTTVPYVTAGQTRTWRYNWANGLMTSVQGPRTDLTAKTLLTYDTSGALIKTTNALGQTVQVVSHTPGGLPLKVIDANGVTTQFTYDPRLRLSRSVLNTAAGNLSTQYTFDAAGNLLRVTQPDGSAISNRYDAAHRLTGVTDLFKQTIAYTLDIDGNRIKTAETDATNAIKRQQTARFDALGRMIAEIGGAGQQTSYAYDGNGNIVSVTDPLNRISARTFDALNHQIAITLPANGTSTTAYDAYDRPVTVTDPYGGTTNYVYDGFGDVIEKISPDSGATIDTYDAAGNLVSKTDATGAIANYTYDALDRLTSVIYPADSAENVVYTYDETGHGFATGRLTTVIDAAGALAKSYDERGNVTGETRLTGGVTLKTLYSYDAVNRIAGLAYPSGTTVAYARDIMGRVTSVSAKGLAGKTAQSVLSNIAYAPFGPQTTGKFANGVTETRSLDGDYRPIAIVDAGLQTLQSLTYGYDAADNVLAINDAVTSANSQAFTYDPLNRLTAANGGYGALSYAYDPVGNRTSQTLGTTATSYSYNSLSNRLATITSGAKTQSVAYTLAGNISSISAGTIGNGMVYNQSGRLASVTTNGKQIALYTYDAFGHRFAKTTTSGTTLFQYDLTGHMLEEDSATGIAKVDYLYLDDGRLIGTITPSNGSLSCILSDRLGTPQLATNSAQSKVWSAAYQPFGQTTSASGSIIQFQRLPGQYIDGETGWYQNGFRDYVPSLGRYLESDPIGLAGGLNTYAYAVGNPLRNVDPLGLCTNDDDDGMQQLLRDKDNNHGSRQDPIDINELLDKVWNEILFDAQAIPAEAGLFRAFSEVDAMVALGGDAEEANVGTPIWRVWGGDPTVPDAEFSPPFGHSWTSVDPSSITNFRGGAGLPDENLGRFVSEGILNDANGVTRRSALPIGNNNGGLNELLIPNPESQITVTGVYGVNPNF